MKTFHNEFGDKVCDSTYVLHLEIRNYEMNEFTVSEEENCDSYLWDPMGYGYTTNDTYDPEDHVYYESGTYHRTYTNIQGCDSIVTMNVQFDYTPSPTDIYPMDTANPAPHWVITASEFEINSYDFHLWEQNPDCHWDTVTWSFEEPLTWILEPFGSKGKCCKVYVLNHVDDTVWLEAHVFNRCAPEEGVRQRYWFLCSFYGIEDRPEDFADFSVIPNPNNGQMTLRLENLTGKVDVKVYDMTGRMVDVVRICNDMANSTIQYDMKGCSSGVYFFVATGKEGVMAKKVIIR